MKAAISVNKKYIATSFLQLGSSGRVREAFDKYVHPDIRHHLAFFKGDRESYLNAMEQNAQEFPDKTYETLRALEDGDLVAIHGKVAFTSDRQWSVIHAGLRAFPCIRTNVGVVICIE